MSVTLVRGDAAHLPLPDGSVDLIVTSPPYFALRSYQDGGEHYAGQIGSEATPAEFIDALIACTREWVRVLKPSGSLWVNLGDKYAGNHANDRSRFDPERYPTWSGKKWRTPLATPVTDGGRPKSLLGIPWRYALRCIDDLGLILRAEVIWSKPNGLPESVTDRVRRSHEQWFHMVLRPRYYAAVDTIREPHGVGTMTRGGGRNGLRIRATPNPSGTAENGRQDWEGGINPLGALPGSVWSIPSQPLTVPAGLGVDHFAAFPMELPRRIIQGWSPSGICVSCGEGRRPVVDKAAVPHWKGGNTGYNGIGRGDLNGMSYGATERSRFNWEATVTGECCACTPYTDHPGSGKAHDQDELEVGRLAGLRQQGTEFSNRPNMGSLERYTRVGPWREYHDWTPPPTRPAVVLDPFSGTGTVALMADVLGRHGIGVDLSHDYNRLARWRTTDPGERARAMQVDKPESVPDGQMQLFA